MRAVEAGRIAWSAVPTRTARFVRRVDDGGPFLGFPPETAALNQLIALCHLEAARLIEITAPSAHALDDRRPRPVRLTARGRALLTPQPRSQP